MRSRNGNCLQNVCVYVQKKPAVSTDTIIKWEDDDDSHFHTHMYDHSRRFQRWRCQWYRTNWSTHVGCLYMCLLVYFETNDHCENVPWKVRKIINLTHAQWENWSHTRRFGWIDVNKNSALFHTCEHNARKEDKKEVFWGVDPREWNF